MSDILAETQRLLVLAPWIEEGNYSLVPPCLIR